MIPADPAKDKRSTLAMSFFWAFRGIFLAFTSQRNFRIHCLIMLAVIFLGIITQISLSEWAIIAVTCGMVLGLEAFNTAVEKLTDLVSPEIDPRAGAIKDIAAGGVLLAALAAVVTGMIIFLPKII